MHPWEEFRQMCPYGEIQFTTKVGYTGIIRINRLDTFCGYIVLPPDHPYFEKCVYEFDEALLELDVHGGITFSDYLDKDTYAIGFDCAHAADYVPSRGVAPYPTTWKDEFFVREELEHLARQLKEKELSND